MIHGPKYDIKNLASMTNLFRFGSIFAAINVATSGGIGGARHRINVGKDVAEKNC